METSEKKISILESAQRRPILLRRKSFFEIGVVEGTVFLVFGFMCQILPTALFPSIFPFVAIGLLSFFFLLLFIIFTGSIMVGDCWLEKRTLLRRQRIDLHQIDHVTAVRPTGSWPPRTTLLQAWDERVLAKIRFEDYRNGMQLLSELYDLAEEIPPVFIEKKIQKSVEKGQKIYIKHMENNLLFLVDALIADGRLPGTDPTQTWSTLKKVAEFAEFPEEMREPVYRLVEIRLQYWQSEFSTFYHEKEQILSYTGLTYSDLLQRALKRFQRREIFGTFAFIMVFVVGLCGFVFIIGIQTHPENWLWGGVPCFAAVGIGLVLYAACRFRAWFRCKPVRVFLKRYKNAQKTIINRREVSDDVTDDYPLS
jgi:hypothetical protein